MRFTNYNPQSTVTLRSQLLDNASMTGDIYFLDPWFTDYAGSGERRDVPVFDKYTTATTQSVFLGQGVLPNPSRPYYIVRAPLNTTINGVPAVWDHWDYDPLKAEYKNITNGEEDYDAQYQTAIVIFHNVSSATYFRAIYVIKSTLAANWNMVSVPNVLTNMQKSAVWPSTDFGTAFSYNGAYVAQVETAPLVNGTGYWVKTAASKDVYYSTGNILTSTTIAVTDGWNMIGSLSAPLQTSAVIWANANCTSQWYGYESGSPHYGYFATTTIEPGKAYWIRVQLTGAPTDAHTITLNINSTANNPPCTSIETPPLGPPSSPSAPVLASPTNGAIDQATGITLSWNPSSGATRFHVQVALSLDMYPLAIDDATVTGTGRSDVLAYNTWYWWRVSAINDVGESPWSSIWAFKTVNPVCEHCPPPDPCGNSIVYAGGNGPQPNQVAPPPCDEEWRTHHGNAAEEGTVAMPTHYALEQNVPNPYNPTTVIRYALPQDGFVQLRVFNMLGQEVTSLVNAFQAAGYHSVEFDGSRLTSGLYFYRMQAGNFTDTKKMMLVK